MQKILSLVLIVLLVTIVGCKKDSSNPTNPNTPASNLFGSGSLSFTADSLGTFSFSGSWTGASVGSSGTAVEALTGRSSTDYAAIIIAYRWHSSTNWDNAVLGLTTANPITTGTYTTSNGLTFYFTKGGTSAGGNSSNMFILTSGSCQVTSYSSSGMKGTISGTAIRATDQATVTITNASFDVTFGTQTM
jgi:hypothetical protein